MLAVVVLAIAVSASVAAAGTTTYHGTFSGPVVYKGCGGAVPQALAGGTWNVALHGATDATVSFDIFVDGAHHVSYGGTVPQLAPAKGQTFAVQFETQAGTLTVSLAGAALTYRIAPYDLFGISCGSVTYSGTLGR